MGDKGVEYKVSVANFDGQVFSVWDDGTKNNIRTLTLTGDTSIKATYDIGDSLRGFISLTYTGTPEQPDLTVNALSLDGTRNLHRYAIIDAQSISASSTTYKVYAGDYQNIVFDHWDDGSKDRVKELAIDKATILTAYCETG